MQTFLSDILHVISQALLAPDIILLILLIAYAIFSIGSILVEFVTEHRHYKVVMPQFLAALTSASEGQIPAVVEESGLLKRQKEALNTVFEYRSLPGDALVALVRRLMNQEESHYERITSRNNMAAKVAPMLGLVGTLIPLGPGIQALGEANTELLSSSLLVAFDTTVAGLVVAAVCLVIGKIRSQWYDNYLSALDSAMATMVQKIQDTKAQTSGGAAFTAVSQDFSVASAPDFFADQPSGLSSFGTGSVAPAVPPVPMAEVVSEDITYTGAGMPLNPEYDRFFPSDAGQQSAVDDVFAPGNDRTLPVD